MFTCQEKMNDFDNCEITLFLALPPSDFRAFKNVWTENLYNIKTMRTWLLLMMLWVNLKQEII